MTESTTAAETMTVPNEINEENTKSALIKIQNYDFFYGTNQVLFDVNMDIPEKQIGIGGFQVPGTP